MPAPPPAESGRRREPGPSYLDLHSRGKLTGRIEQAVRRLRSCDLCPRRCRVDRTEGETGKCRTGRWARVASAGPHFGEERPLVGSGGSGTIFFACCNLACTYCQNAEISQHDHGHEVSPTDLADLMLSLQRQGCENINFVSPSHVVAQILEALPRAISNGLDIPLVYNTGGYDAVDTLRLLEGVFDIYMPDAKYADEDTAHRLSGIRGYARHNRDALREMHRQVGDLTMNDRGVATRGLLVRHLVLPENLAGSREVLRFLAQDISPDTYVNVMDQYHPAHRAHGDPEVGRRPTAEEYDEALQAAEEAGLHRLDGRRRWRWFP